jgi:hypothetical protein
VGHADSSLAFTNPARKTSALMPGMLFGQGKRRPKFIPMLGFIATSLSFVLFKCWFLISVSPFELSLSSKARRDNQNDHGGR